MGHREDTVSSAAYNLSLPLEKLGLIPFLQVSGNLESLDAEKMRPLTVTQIKKLRLLLDEKLKVCERILFRPTGNGYEHLTYGGEFLALV